MTEGPPFERYPGPPRRDDASFRVISPWRDALAWVSVAGLLAVSRFLVREEDGWRDALVGTPRWQEPDGVPWRLERRDPVELVFRTTGDSTTGAVAYVSVTRTACVVRVEGVGSLARVRELVAVPDEARIVEREGVVKIEILAR